MHNGPQSAHSGGFTGYPWFCELVE